MPYIRLSITKPRRGEEAHLEEVVRKLSDLSAAQDGCIESYVLRPHDDSGEVVRIAVYADELAAERAANTQSFLALRSELHLIAEPGHVERALFTI